MKENVFERVDRLLNLAVKHYKSGKNATELPEDLANIFQRWEMAHRLTKLHYQKGKEYIFSTYATWLHHNFGITDNRTIREDLYAAPLLFTKIEPTNREFKRMLAIERLEMSIRKAEIAGKYAEQARLEAVLFKYLNPVDDPVEEKNMDEIAKTFHIRPAFEPKILGIEERSQEDVLKFKEKMILKKKKLLDEVEEAEVIKPESEDLEDERTI